MSSLSNLNDYWRLHSDELAERILASYPLSMVWTMRHHRLSRRCCALPIRSQSLAIMGVAKRWQISRGAHVVAECGAGKTLIALGMMFVHAQGRPFSGIVMAPPHLVEKWARENLPYPSPSACFPDRRHAERRRSQAAAWGQRSPPSAWRNRTRGSAHHVS